MRGLHMRTGIFVTLSDADRRRLEALVADRNTPQKHVWRGRIVLMSADGFGTAAIMPATDMEAEAIRQARWTIERLQSAMPETRALLVANERDGKMQIVIPRPRPLRNGGKGCKRWRRKPV